MSNAKTEFIEHIRERDVLCADISLDTSWDEETRKHYSLPREYTKEQYEAFLNSLDFNYDDGYGGQELFGNIWYKDGTWSDRGEYDGSEWWEYRKCPEIPQNL